jgi:hypothetical protein
MPADGRPILDQLVDVGGASRRFGELTTAEVAAHAATLREMTGWGPTARVGSFARAWDELARTMEERDAATVAELDAAELQELAPRLWVIPPGG